jgi:homoserine/homoserine lactone efflux protein
VSPETFIAFATAAFVIIVIPGPTNLTIVSDSLDAGVRRSLWTVAGAAVSHAGFIVVATAGVGAIVGSHPEVFVFIKWFGVIYLVLQGVRLIVKQPATLDARTQPKGRGVFSHLLKGFVVNSTNPKALLFYAALFPPFVNPRAALVPQLLVLAVTFLVLFLIVGALHSVLGQSARNFLSNRRSATLANRVSGGVMIGAAVWMATK